MNLIKPDILTDTAGTITNKGFISADSDSVLKKITKHCANFTHFDTEIDENFNEVMIKVGRIEVYQIKLFTSDGIGKPIFRIWDTHSCCLAYGDLLLFGDKGIFLFLKIDENKYMKVFQR